MIEGSAMTERLERPLSPRFREAVDYALEHHREHARKGGQIPYASHLLAVVANGGAMPASPAALDALGFGVGGNTNSVVVAQPAFEPLTDIFAMPRWMPFANIFSIGDVVIGVGVAIAIAAAMRARTGRPRPD